MRSIIAVLAGGVVTAVLFQVGVIIAFVVVYGIPLGSSPGPPDVGYYLLNLGFAGIAAVAGGWITARLARRVPLAHVGALALLLAGLVLWGFNRRTSQWPRWYAPVAALAGVAGTLAGGFIRRGS